MSRITAAEPKIFFASHRPEEFNVETGSPNLRGRWSLHQLARAITAHSDVRVSEWLVVADEMPTSQTVAATAITKLQKVYSEVNVTLLTRSSLKYLPDGMPGAPLELILGTETKAKDYGSTGVVLIMDEERAVNFGQDRYAWAYRDSEPTDKFFAQQAHDVYGQGNELRLTITTAGNQGILLSPEVEQAALPNEIRVEDEHLFAHSSRAA